MCTGNPDEILAEILEARPLQPNGRGHAPMGDFDRFCACSGCIEDDVGKDAFAWAKFAYMVFRIDQRNGTHVFGCFAIPDARHAGALALLAQQLDLRTEVMCSTCSPLARKTSVSCH